MSLAGSQLAGMGSVLTAAYSGDDATVGPDSPLNWLFDLPLSFGQGLHDTDDTIPDLDGNAETFWLSPTLDSDHAEADQSHSWPTDDPLDYLRLIVYVDAASLPDGGGDLVVTVDDVDTDILVTIPAGASSGLTLQDEGAAYVPALSRIGVRFRPDEACTGGTLRVEARLRGRWPGANGLPDPTEPGGSPLIWLEADLDVTRGALDIVTQWTNQGSLGLGVGQPPTIFAGPPTWVDGEINGLPIIRFSKAGVTLLTSDVVTPFAPGDPFTAIFVVRPTSADGGIFFSSPFQDGSPFRGVGLLTDAGDQYPFPSEFTGAGPTVDGGPVDYTGLELLCAYYFDGTAGSVDVAGVRLATTGAVDVPNAGDAYCIGGAAIAGFNGSWAGSDVDMAAAIIYAGDLEGTAVIAQTLAYLRAKWGVA